MELSDLTTASSRLTRRWAVGILVLVVVFGVVSAQLLRTSHRRTQLQVATAAAYAQSRTGAEQRRTAADELVRRVAGPATYRASNVSCRLERDEAGWQVQDWRQVCAIRSVDVYPTELGYTDLAAQLVSASLARPNDLVGEPVRGTAPRQGCGPVRSYNDPGLDPELRVVLTRLEAHRFSVATSPASQECGLPLLVQADTPNDRRTKVDTTFSTSEVDVNRSWLVMERDMVFFREELGCSGLVYCASPVRQPVLP